LTVVARPSVLLAALAFDSALDAVAEFVTMPEAVVLTVSLGPSQPAPDYHV